VRRPALVFAALILVLVAHGERVVADPAGSGPSGVSYDVELTCSTNTVTVTANVEGRVADPFDFGIVYDDGGFAMSSIGRLGPGQVGKRMTLPANSYPTATGRTLVERVAADRLVPIAAIVDHSDACPDYSHSPESVLVPMTPTRFLDTRSNSRVGYVGEKPMAGDVVRVPVAGHTGVPDNAVAAVVNLTIVDATAPGYVQALPDALPEFLGKWSNANADKAGQVIPNGTILPLGEDGSLALFTERGAHLLLDVAGYFVPVAVHSGQEGRFGAIRPTRVLDTRNESLPAAGAKRMVQVTGGVDIPAAKYVSAVALNVTAVDARSSGFVQVAPGGALAPGATSSLNVEAGQTIANLVIVPVAPDGTVEFFSTAQAHLLVDVVGVFSREPNFVGGYFVPVQPERVLDSRPASAVAYPASVSDRLDQFQMPGTLSRAWQLSFIGLSSTGVGAVLVNVTATGSTAAGFVQAGPGDGKTSTLNVERADQTVANSALVGAGNYDNIFLYTSAPTHLIADVFGFFTRN
jgi:hypothetical protein